MALVNLGTASSTEKFRSFRNQSIMSSSSLPFFPTGSVLCSFSSFSLTSTTNYSIWNYGKPFDFIKACIKVSFFKNYISNEVEDNFRRMSIKASHLKDFYIFVAFSSLFNYLCSDILPLNQVSYLHIPSSFI